MFCLYFDAKTKAIRALNGSGRAPKNTSVEQIRKELGIPEGKNTKIPTLSSLSVTVPGAAAGWVDTVEKFGSGKLTLEQILTPAIELAENGFPVSEFSAKFVSLLHLPRMKLTRDSGKITNRLSATRHKTSARCSSATRMPRTLFVLPGLERSSAILLSPRPSARWQRKARRASTVVG